MLISNLFFGVLGLVLGFASRWLFWEFIPTARKNAERAAEALGKAHSARLNQDVKYKVIRFNWLTTNVLETLGNPEHVIFHYLVDHNRCVNGSATLRALRVDEKYEVTMQMGTDLPTSVLTLERI